MAVYKNKNKILQYFNVVIQDSLFSNGFWKYVSTKSTEVFYFCLLNIKAFFKNFLNFKVKKKNATIIPSAFFYLFSFI